ncbi:hypothetical protein DMH15_18070 [Streptomyces sp. WAC 06725]|uniref:hypothetical protein n=1 Tax=Streptomyces sp. WAC 06725 TaxID=2203209 RepID=UPI000F7434CC|nr:hypothetical protein [Streptomyces sp. WAC 06725]RSO37812.1 hypothetical protein DMH15_18070 [Streptomyces sp. WAC 06725]
MLVGAFTAAGATAVYLRRFCAETFRRATRPWAGGAAFAAVSTTLASARGLWKSSAWDVGETCGLRGHPYDIDVHLGPHGQQGFLPLFSNKCDASYAHRRT